LSGEPIITGTRTSVRSIVGLWRLGVVPEEILNHLPHLTLAQVFDALSFYLDNQAEINEYIILGLSLYLRKMPMNSRGGLVF
jgi:uncharacterized protein (DUF433 family)